MFNFGILIREFSNKLLFFLVLFFFDLGLDFYIYIYIFVFGYF